MKDVLYVVCNCVDLLEARRIADAVIDERLIACVNVLPSVQSIYRWEGKVNEAHEVPIVMKTTRERFPALRDRIAQLHSHAVPEILALPVVEGFEKYLAWVAEEVQE